MRRTVHRRDGNHDEILAVLKKVTYCLDIHNYGQGMGDILAVHTRTKAAVFLEVKSSAKDELTGAEVIFSIWFRKNWVRVNTAAEALHAIGIYP